jgi:hypothetical protein
MTTLNTMFTTTNVTADARADAVLFILSVISPSLILLTAISLLATRPSPLLLPLPITSVTVSTRRGLILSCLYSLSFIHLLDGLAFVVYALIIKCWPQRTGIEFNSLIGLVASSGLAAVGTWKDIEGVEVWLLKRMKIVVSLSFVLDIAQAVLYGTSMHKGCTYIFPWYFSSTFNAMIYQTSLILTHIRVTFKLYFIFPCKFCAFLFFFYYSSRSSIPSLRTPQPRLPMMS